MKRNFSVNQKIKYLAGITMLFFTALANAQDFEATHKMTSSTSDATGLNTATLQFIISNNTDIDYSNISTELSLSKELIAFGGPALTIDTLPAGGTATITWTISSAEPVEILLNGLPLTFNGTALDSNGETIAITFNSDMQ